VNINEKICPRWWYVAILNCDMQDVEMAYSVHVTNPLAGWQHEFSVDRFWATHLCLILLIIYSIVCFFQLLAIDKSNKLGKETHPLLQQLTASDGFSVVQVVALCIHYIRFSWTGQGVLWLYILAKIAGAVSKMFLMATLLLISGGRCVSTPMVIGDAFLTFLVVCPFMLSCLMIELWSEFGSIQQYTTDYVYSTPPGWLLVAIDVCLFSLYLVRLLRTSKNENDTKKQHFYSSWGALYSTWFLVLPVMALVAIFLPSWVRFMVVFAATHLMRVFMYVILISGLWPTKEDSHFVFDTVEMEPMGAAWERLEGSLPASS